MKKSEIFDKKYPARLYFQNFNHLAKQYQKRNFTICPILIWFGDSKIKDKIVH